ncbi:MAG TPA: hypothetical protein VMT03_06330 [Polyangia bacterium]|nr:hypothetical protein [Polyangia bacterium]
MLARLQLGLEALYRVETRLPIDAFLVDAETREAALGGGGRLPREQLVVRQVEGELAMALFVDQAALTNLERHDPADRLDERNFTDFCLAVEGVSHFVYLALCAAGDRAVSQLELELQAEVDKYACCLLLAGRDPALRRRLYRDVRFADDLDPDERSRYQAANAEANRYAAALERRFVDTERTDALLTELRRFYRMALADKLGRIATL